MLELNHLSINKRLHKISAVLPTGKLHALTGPNGSGKSTLLKIIAGTVVPELGNVRFNGVDLATLDRRARSKLISYVPQSYTMPYPYTVYEMVAMGLYAAKGSSTLIDLCLQKVEALSFRDIPFTDLSTGEKQRVLIARGLATQCPILLFDEPTANLDLRFQRHMWDLIGSLCEENYTILVASHDLEQIRKRCDQCLILNEGHLLTYGPSSNVLIELETIYNVSDPKLRFTT